MLKLILLIIVGYIIYKVFWQKSIAYNRDNDLDENDLIECSVCHTFVPKNECEFRMNGCVCKDCR